MIEILTTVACLATYLIPAALTWRYEYRRAYAARRFLGIEESNRQAVSYAFRAAIAWPVFLAFVAGPDISAWFARHLMSRSVRGELAELQRRQRVAELEQENRELERRLKDLGVDG